VSDAELLAAYQATAWSVSAPGGTVRVCAGAAAPPALRPSAIVTAYNPASKLVSPGQNEHADQALLARIRALGLHPWRTRPHGAGDDPSAWDEPGFCLPGETREAAVALGRDFGQNAIVWIDAAGQVAMVCTRDGFCDARVGEVVG
jgi:Protein of unknown function (DUF3293)